MISELEERAHQLAKQDRFIIGAHAILRMRERRVFRDEVKYVLTYGRINPKRTRHHPAHPSPSYAFEAVTYERRFLRVVAAIEEEILVVTVVPED